MSSQRSKSLQFGDNGAIVVDDTATYTGDFGIFFPMSTCVIDQVQSKPGRVEIDNVAGFSGKTLIAGCPIYGWITSFKLTSGWGVLYKAP